MIVGLDIVTAKNFASGMGMILCSSKKFIPNTMLKSSIFTVTKSVYPVQVHSLIKVLYATSKTSRAAKLTAFIFPLSRCQRMFKRFASNSVMKLWVSPKSTMVFLAAL